MYGSNGESSSKRSSLDAVRAERRVRRDVHEPRARRPAAPGRARAAVPPTFTSKSSRTVSRGMDDRRGVEHRRAADAVEERGRSPTGSRTSPTTTSIRGSITSSSGASPGSCTRHRMRRRLGLAGERPHEVLAEPARGAGDHNAVLGVAGVGTAVDAISPRVARPTDSSARPGTDRSARLAFPCAPSRARCRRVPRAPVAAASALSDASAHHRRADDRRARVRAAAARAVPLAGPADGRGLHARLPGAGAEGRDPEPRLPAPLRAREPVGARRRVQGVRRLAAQRARVRPAAAARDRVRRSTRSRAAGAGSSPSRPRSRRRSSSSRSASPRWRGSAASASAVLRPGGRRRSARAEPDDRRARRWALAAGLLLGLAVLFRLDLVLGVGLATVALVRGMDRSRASTASSRASSSASLPYVDPARDRRARARVPGHGDRPRVPASAAGAASRSRRRGDTSTASCSRPARSQQISWPFPALARPHQLFLWFFLLLGAIAFVLWQGWRATRADPASITRPHAARRRAVRPRDPPAGPAARRLRPLRVGQLRRVRVRPDRALRARAPARAERARPAALAIGCGRARCSPCSRSSSPRSRSAPYADYSLQTFGIHRASYKIEHDGRVFYYGKPDRAAAANMVIAAAAKISKPGQRLFVGPVDLRKTPYSDAYLYYMLPDLVPATYYIEMDPGVANANDSRPAARPRVGRHRDPLRRSGTTGASRTTPRKVGSDTTAAGPRPRLLPRRHVSRPVPALPEVPLTTPRSAADRFPALCERSSSLRPTRSRRTSSSSCSAPVRPRPTPTSSSSTTTAPTAPPISPTRSARGSGTSRCCAGPRKIGIGDAVRAGLRARPRPRLRRRRADRRRPLARSGRAPRRSSPRSRTAPTPRSARATCPAARSRTGPGTGGRSRSGATATRRSCSASRSATRPRATARFAPTRSKTADFAHTRSKGYGFQIELCYRVWQHGGRIAQVPITFTDRVRGHSKMSLSVGAEELGLVTWWALAGPRAEGPLAPLTRCCRRHAGSRAGAAAAATTSTPRRAPASVRCWSSGSHRCTPSIVSARWPPGQTSVRQCDDPDRAASSARRSAKIVVERGDATRVAAFGDRVVDVTGAVARHLEQVRRCGRRRSALRARCAATT